VRLPDNLLDPHLAEALSRTRLPDDFTTDDIKFPWPGFRPYLSKQLRLSTKATQSEVQYLDIALAQQNEAVRLQEELASDLLSGLKKIGRTPSDFYLKVLATRTAVSFTDQA
jgi:hypothetical protein